VSLPAPVPGLVVSYSFLWCHESKAGLQEGAKYRPCAIVVARQDERGETRVIVVPITHAPPPDASVAIEIPAAVKARLRLDGERSWILADQLNRFTWPGFDLRQIPGRPGAFAYGMLPRGLYEEIRKLILSLDAAQKLAVIRR
jgi:hypothetical protein